MPRLQSPLEPMTRVSLPARLQLLAVKLTTTALLLQLQNLPSLPIPMVLTSLLLLLDRVVPVACCLRIPDRLLKPAQLTYELNYKPSSLNCVRTPIKHIDLQKLSAVRRPKNVQQKYRLSWPNCALLSALLSHVPMLVLPNTPMILLVVREGVV